MVRVEEIHLEHAVKILECGLTVLSYHESECPPHSGYVYLVVKAGKQNEEEHELGFSHFLEHILLRAVNVDDRFPGKHETLVDHTIYGFPVENDDETSKALQLLATIATHVEITDRHVAAERDVISVENLELVEDSDFETTYVIESVIHDKIKEEEISATEIFQRGLPTVAIDDVRAYYKKWYKLSNMCLIFVGNCQDILAKVESKFIGEREEVPIRSPVVRKGIRIEVFDHAKIDPKAFVVIKEPRNTVRRLIDLINHWNDKTKMSAFNDIMQESVHGESVSGSLFQSERHILHVFTSTPLKKLSMRVFTTLYKEVQRWMKVYFPQSHIRRARQQLFEKLEFKTRKYSTNVKFRCSRIKDKLRKKFLYGDVAFHPSCELAMARKWLNSDSRWSSFVFDKRSNQYIMVNRLSIDKKAIKREVLKWKREVLKEPSLQEEDDEFDEVAGLLSNNNQSISAITYAEIGLSEWTLSNGMKIAYHQSEHVNECSLQGFAYGGLSESRDNYISHKNALYVVDLLSTSGDNKVFKDSERVDVNTYIGLYTRLFEAFKVKGSELEIVLQKLHLLFITNKLPDAEKLTSEAIASAIRRSENEKLGFHSALKTARGSSAFSTVPSSDDAPQVDVLEACKYFNACFCDPSQFTVIIVGNLAVSKIKDMIMKYMSSIPKKECPLSFPDDPYKLNKVPILFPEEKDRTCLMRLPPTMLTNYYISISVSLDIENLDRDKILVERCMELMQDCLTRRLRYVLCKIYSVSGELEFDGGYYASRKGEFAIITFDFTAIDRDMAGALTLIDAAIQALESFRLSGPLEPRKMEMDDDIIMPRLVDAYYFVTSDRDVQRTYKAHEEMRKQIAAMGIEDMRKEIKRLFPTEFTAKHVAVVVRPDKDEDLSPYEGLDP